MNLASAIVLAVVLAAVVAALLHIRRKGVTECSSACEDCALRNECKKNDKR